MPKKLTIEHVRKVGLEKGLYLNSEVYINNSTLMSWSCAAEWHPVTIRFGDVGQDHRCPICAITRRAEDRKLDIEEVRARGLEKGHYLNSETYVDSQTDLNWSCMVEWHNFEARYNTIDQAPQGDGCPVCAKQRTREFLRHDIEHVRKVGLDKGFYLNSDDYINNKIPVDWSCVAEWHPFPAAFGNIVQDSGCPGCVDNLGWQTDFYTYLVKLLPHLLTEQRVLKNKRFRTDVWDPINRKALELDGEYWHDRPRTMEIDARKNKEYEEAGINLLRIKFYEWEKDPEATYEKAIQFFNPRTLVFCHALNPNLYHREP
jgi:hypothetical protein